MKRIAKLLLLAALAVVVAGAAPAFGEPPATLATWSLANTLTGTTIVPDALVVGDIAAGNGVGSLSLSGKGYSGHGWNSASRSEDAYFEFSVTAITNWSFSPGELSMNFRSTKTGPAKAEVRWSLDGSAWTTAGTMDVPLDGNDRGHPFTVDFTGVTVGSGETFAIRIYAWGASANTGTFRIGNAYAMTLSGSVAAPLDPSAPPRLHAIDDVEVDVGEKVSFPVLVDAPEAAPVTSLEITAGDPAATLEDGVFSFTPAAAGRYAFTLSAVNANGDATISFNVDASSASDALVVDSSFETGVSGWDVYKESGGKCTLQARDGKLMLAVSSVGTASYSVQTFYDGVPLYKNGRYRLKYDISCTTERHVESMILQNGGTYQTYTWRELEIKPEPQTVDYEFTMSQDSDRMSKFVFNCGLFEKDSALPEHIIYIDNVSLVLLNPEEVVPPVTIYPLWVGGVQVTSANATNILGDGTASFEGTATNGTLSLSNATITATYQFEDSDGSTDSANVFSGEGFDLTISLTGSNILQNADHTLIVDQGHGYGVRSQGDLAITGGGALVAWVEYDGAGIRTDGNLLIDGAVVTAHSAQDGINVDGGLVISNAVLTVRGSNYAGISGGDGGIDIADSVVTVTGYDGIDAHGYMVTVSGASVVTAETTYDDEDERALAADPLVLRDGLAVTEPAGGAFDAGSGYVVDPATGKAALRVVIAPPAVFPLWVGGVQVCETNQNDILGDGTASFAGSASGGTLSLSNATITATHSFEWAYDGRVVTGAAAIYAGPGLDLALDLSGSNVVGSAIASDGVFAEANLSISGPGVLDATANEIGVVSGDGALRVDGGATVVATGAEVAGLFGSLTVTISNATVRATSGNIAYGIRSYGGGIDIADADVSATGGNFGVDAEEGALRLGVGSRLTATATGAGFNCAVWARDIAIDGSLSVEEPAAWTIAVSLTDINGKTIQDTSTRSDAVRVVIGPRTYSVTVEGGSTTNTTARAGETVTIVANAPAEGEGFVEWSADDAMDLSFATAAATTTTFAMPARAVTVTAVFKEIQIDSIPDQEWTGGPVEPEFRSDTVKFEGTDMVLLPGTDYTVSYTNNVDPGTATATVTMAPPRTGHASATFRILPPPEPPAVSNVVARQRWPWNGLVDVDYEVGGDTNLLAGVTARITFEERIEGGTGRIWVASNFLAGAEPSAAPGPHRATWDTAADGATNVVAAEVVATVALVREEPIVYNEFLYEIGGESAWSVPHPLYGKDRDGKYLGYYYLNSEFKFRPNAHDWNGDYEFAGEGRIADNGGANCPAPEPSFYRIQVDLADGTYALEAVRSITMVGTHNSWNVSDLATHMSFDLEEGCWTIDYTFAEQTSLKFAMNDDWTVSWGGANGDASNYGDLTENNGKDLSVASGKYRIKLYLSCEGSNRVAFVPKE